MANSTNAPAMGLKTSPFLHPGPVASTDQLSIIHLKRDLQTPTLLRDHDADDEGYSEGKVVNTRFGSFPHSTLIGLQWGSQVRASKVDTGSRGRRVKGQDGKRKRDEPEPADSSSKKLKLEIDEEIDDASTPTTAREEVAAVVASSGFIHLLPPTPENWTSSLPHRTQVVYTPDYSYILHRLRAQPGTNLIEAGAGSGSFTHASARAVFSGYGNQEKDSASPMKKRKLGKVWSYEFHEPRHQKLQEEIQEHGLDQVVNITHRDVCEEGFLVDGKSPGAEAIFLDLPAPWLALPHLSRSKVSQSKTSTPPDVSSESSQTASSSMPFVSALNPEASVYICTFSPCIEQVQKTVSVMRQLGWVDIEMVEVSAKRFEIRRERVGIDNSAQRGSLPTPASVSEAVTRLIEVEGAFKNFHETGEKQETKRDQENPNSKEKIIESLVERKVYKEGKLTHRAEPEVKTHTSYLVFAILPREWSAEEEAKAAAQWPVTPREDDGKEEVIGMSRRQRKRAEKQAKRENAVKGEKGGKGGLEGSEVNDSSAMDTAE